MKRIIKNFGVEFDEVSLINGVKLYSFYKPNSPIYFRVYFYAGSQYDGKKPGLAHFCEHMIVSGTEKFPTKDLINERIQEIGGQKNAFTNKKNLWLTLDLADKADLPEMLDLTDQMINYSLLTQEGIDIEKKVILAEQTRKSSNPAHCIYELEASLLYQGTNIENPVLGTSESVGGITRENLIDYRNKYLLNGNVAYFISGDFDQEIMIDALNKITRNCLPINIPNEQLVIINNKKRNY